MTSRLVDDVRRLIRDRQETGHPLTDLERVFLLAAITAKASAGDVVDELEAAIVTARRVLLTTPHPGADPALVEQHRQRAARALIAAARAVLDFDPFREPHDPAAALDGMPEDPRPRRADIDA